MAERKFDLVLFGATGFTGTLAAKYLASKYGDSSLKWAIAGRSKSKLEALREQCKGLPEIIIADSTDEAAIKAMVAQTRCIITTAGPFRRYGSHVVKSCAEFGTDYCDITAEIPWVRDMIALYDDKARETGARIVHYCGHDCVPWDLTCMKLAQKLKEKGESLTRVDCYDDAKGTVSGGTLETFVGLLFGAEGKLKPLKDLGYDPLLKDGKEASACKTDVQNVSCVTPGQDGRPTRTYFIMADVNGHAVKRSNALLKYGENVTYCEGTASANNCQAYCTMTGMAMGGCLLSCPPTRACLRKLLPKPGEGPSEADMDQGYLTVTGVGVGEKGTKVVSELHFPTDPGYRDTARMLVESGLTFILEKSFTCPGGVYTPASCQGETLFKRLVDTGCTFKYHE